MLGKLIKHELRGSGRVMLPFILLSLVLSVLAGFAIRFMDRQTDYDWFTVIFGIMIFLFAAGLVTVCVMALVVMIERFRKNLLGDEGYVMFTLPVSVDAHIFSKLIVSTIWFILTGIVCLVAALLVMIVNMDSLTLFWQGFDGLLPELMGMIRLVGAGHVVGYCVELLILSLLLSFVNCLHFYLAMAVGYSFANRKVLISVVAYFAVSFVFTMLQSGFAFGMDGFELAVNFGLSMDDYGYVHLMFITAVLYSIIHAAILYLPTRILLKHRLNLP